MSALFDIPTAPTTHNPELPEVRIAGRTLTPTAVFDTYWRFAAARHRMYVARLEGTAGPWTDDDVLLAHRFTNVFRAADRVSQYLISVVQRGDASASPADVVFRTLLFKIFNREGTWRALERSVGPVTWATYDFDAYRAALDTAAASGPIYSPAYVMPPPRLGEVRKHANHLRLLEHMMIAGLPQLVQRAPSLRSVYAALSDYPGIGPFLAFQYTIDLNYSDVLAFDENDFVVAGPGARDGIRKCFGREASGIEDDVIRYMVATQDEHFDRLGLPFDGLFGRPLHLIDAQNLFCEVDKYARVRHPEITGISGRSRIKQRFTPAGSLASPVFPKRWGLASRVAERMSAAWGDGARVQIDCEHSASASSEVPPGREAHKNCPLPF